MTYKYQHVLIFSNHVSISLLSSAKKICHLLPNYIYYLAKEIWRPGEENGNSKWNSWEYLDT